MNKDSVKFLGAFKDQQKMIKKEKKTTLAKAGINFLILCVLCQSGGALCARCMKIDYKFIG